MGKSRCIRLIKATAASVAVLLAQGAHAEWVGLIKWAELAGGQPFFDNPNVHWDKAYYEQYGSNRWWVPAVKYKGRWIPAVYFMHIPENPNMHNMVWAKGWFKSFFADTTTPFPAPGAEEGLFACQANTPTTQTETSTFTLTDTQSNTNSWNRKSSFEWGLEEGISEEIGFEANEIFAKETEKTTFSFKASQKWGNEWGESHDNTRSQAKAYSRTFSETSGVHAGFIGTPSVSVPFVHIRGGLMPVWVDVHHFDAAHYRFYAYDPHPGNPSEFWVGELNLPSRDWNGMLPNWGILPRLMSIAQYRALCPGDFQSHQYASAQKRQLCARHIDVRWTCH